MVFSNWSNGDRVTYLRANSDAGYGQIYIKVKSSTGEISTFAPTPVTTSNDNNIATTAFVNNFLSVNVVWLTLTASFANYSNISGNQPRVYKTGRVCTLIGTVTPTEDIAGSLNVVQICENLPVGYRPIGDIRSICQGSGMNRWNLQVDSATGYIGMCRYGRQDLETASPGVWLPFYITYISSS